MNRNILLIAFLIVGCGQEEKLAHYREVILSAPQEVSEAADRSLVWDVPPGWEEGESSAMRLASFRLAHDPEAIDVSIVVLPQDAGGLEANLKRWMGQIGLDVSQQQLEDFIAACQRNVFDFSLLQTSGAEQDKSMIVAMKEWQENTVFVKMTGTKDILAKQKSAFLRLVESVRRQ